MKNSSIMVTGAAGEIGSSLIPFLKNEGAEVVALDLNPDYRCAEKGVTTVNGDVCDRELLGKLFAKHEFDTVFHFAGLLSSAAERNPFLAQKVNIEGTNFLIQLSYELGEKRNKPTRFLFTSSIAAYGSKDQKQLRKAVSEDECLYPESLYGIQKLYTEQLGTYFSNRGDGMGLDFRSLRYPGIMSIDTMPTGGTSDYGAEMLHNAHAGKPYACFVSPESSLPFMTMPDAIHAILKLAQADAPSLTRRVYNVRGFSVTARQLKDAVEHHFPAAEISFDPVEWRDRVVNSWPDDVDDSLATRDWGWRPKHDFEKAFSEYFLPGLMEEGTKQSAVC